jgi:LPXTG-motif cell wall-anchored protein
MISVDLAATHGPDHATHLGPVFDAAVNTSNKVPWGDIIPDVLNWDAAGQALYANDCQLPGEPADPEVCEFDEDLDADDAGCVPPVDPEPCVYDESLAADDAGCVPPVDPEPCVYDESLAADDEACVPPTVDECPTVEGDQLDASECTTDPADPTDPAEPTEPTDPTDATEVDDEVVTPTTPTEVAGVQIVRTLELPRTGSDTLPTVALGLGLVLLGAGVMFLARAEIGQEG